MFDAEVDYQSTSSRDRIPVFYLNGLCIENEPEHVVVGELDFFTARIGAEDSHKKACDRRAQFLEGALAEGITLFIGTSLTDPDVIAALAMSRTSPSHRYALLVSPDREETKLESSDSGETVRYRLSDSGSPISGEGDRAFLREIVTRRYLHLGVYPVIADYGHQVALFLRLLTARIEDPASYQAKREFVRRWWDNGAGASFGYTGDSTHPNYSIEGVIELQKMWRDKLVELREELSQTLGLGTATRSRERLETELWLRNPSGRVLFRWASSNTLDMEGASVRTVSWNDAVSAEAKEQLFAYWRGQALFGRLTEHGELRSHYSTPLNLGEERSASSPIGVLSILSTAGANESGALWAAKDDDDLQLEINKTLDKHWTDAMYGDLIGMMTPDTPNITSDE